MKKINRRQQAITQEWMINPCQPKHSLTRLKYRSTYADTTLEWLAAQLDIISETSTW